MRCLLRHLIAVSLLFGLSSFNLAQSTAAPRNPRLGLVLEGGGALGLAHIGVLQWLEEHRIPVDYVAGTSMGGLVGGFYATGHSAAEVKALVKTIDWDQVLQGRTPYKDLSYRRKEDAFDYPNDLEFGLKKGVQFPEGFNSGQQVGFILDQVSLPYSEVKNFDNLPIPFACVSTDLVTAEKYVFRQGSLALALRSTMSLPGIFSPVRWNGHIFADGGLMDNLPVDVAQDMGAQTTLAVHLQVPKLDPDATLSSFSVLGHSISVVIAANERRGIERANIVIDVPLQKYDSLDYGDAEEIIKVGYQAAQAKAESLSALAVDNATWQAYLQQKAARRKTVTVPQFVEVTGANPNVAKAIEADLQSSLGKPVDTGELQDKLLELKGEGRFSNLGYQLTQRNGETGLLINAVPKSYSPPTVLPLLLIDGSNFNGTTFSMGARIVFQDFGSYRAEWRNDVIVGTQYGILSQYYRPLSASSHWYIAPNAFAAYEQYPIYRQNDFLAQYRRSGEGGGLDFGYEFGRIAQLSLGYTAAFEKFKPIIGNTAILPTVSGRVGTTRLRFALNDVDNPVIPRTGQFGTIFGSWVDASPGAAHSFPEAEGRVVKVFRLTRPSSIYFGAAGGTTFGNQLVGVPPFSLGGETLFVAYGQNELLTNQYYAFQAGYLRKLFPLPVLLGEGIYINGLFEAGKIFSSPPFEGQVPGDVAASLVLNTIFGPVSFGGAVGVEGHQSVFFKLGRIF